MNNRNLTILIFSGVIGVVALLLINLAPDVRTVSSPQIASPGNVKGMALYHAGTPFTLNFSQQEFVLDALNRSVKVKKSAYSSTKESFPFEKIVLYRFNGTDIEFVPVSQREQNLIFSAPAIDQDSYLLELSGGELNTLLNQTFDP